MGLRYLHQMINKGESDTLDFKQTISSAPKIAKTMSAFANHKGGTLLVGVKDNKSIAGIRTEDERYMLDLAAHFYCKPELELEIREWEIGGKIILEAIVPEGTDKPYYAKGEDDKWWAYIRVKDQSLLASKVTLEVLKRQGSNRNTVITYTDNEKALLQYLEKNPRITLKQFCKLRNLSRWRATRILVNLVSVGVIRLHNIEQTDFYTLS